MSELLAAWATVLLACINAASFHLSFVCIGTSWLECLLSMCVQQVVALPTIAGCCTKACVAMVHRVSTDKMIGHDDFRPHVPVLGQSKLISRPL